MEGKDHKAVKTAEAEKYRAKGYDVEVEKKLKNGMIVDLVASKDGERIAIEIGALNGENRKNELNRRFDSLRNIPLEGRKSVRKKNNSSKKHVAWKKEVWYKTQGEVKAEYGVNNNEEVQDKILQIVRKHRQ